MGIGCDFRLILWIYCLIFHRESRGIFLAEETSVFLCDGTIKIEEIRI